MKAGDYTTLHNSPQVNLSEIGMALRKDEIRVVNLKTIK